MGLSLSIPKEWGEITLKSQTNGEVYTFDSPNEAIEAIWYHKPSGIIAFIMRGEKYELEYGRENYQEILKVISDRDVKTNLYSLSPNDELAW